MVLAYVITTFPQNLWSLFDLDDYFIYIFKSLYGAWSSIVFTPLR